MDAEYTKLKANHEAAKKTAAITAMDARAGLSESVQSRDNNPRQAQALVK